MNPPPAGNRIREALILACICAVALSVRLLHLAEWAGNPLFHHPVGDELNFHQTALALLGRGPPVEAFLYQPLYPFFLAGVYSLFGVDLGVVRILQLFIGIGTCLLFYGLGREIGGRWTGRLSALLAALYGPSVFFEGLLLAPALCVPLVTAGLWCLVAAGGRNRPWLVAPAGLLLGAAVMGRPNLAVLAPVGAAWLLLRPWPVKRRLLASGLAALSLCAGLLPSWLHNASRGEWLSPVSNSGGINFYIGNNSRATGMFALPKGEKLEGLSHWDFQNSTRAVAERDTGRPLTSSEVSSYWYRRGFRFWTETPWQGMRLLGKKLLLALNSEEMPVHHPYAFAQEVVPILKWLVPFGVVFPFAILGGWLGRRNHPGMGLLLACAGAYLSTLLIFFVADRFRAVLLCALAPLAALGVAGMAEAVRINRLRATWPYLVVLAAAFGLTQIPMTGTSFRQRALSEGYIRMGKVEGERGDLEAAERNFRRALALAGPRGGALAVTNLGQVYELRGNWRQARQLYLQAADADPNSRIVRVFLARLAERTGDLEEAVRWWEEAAALMANPESALLEVQRLRRTLKD